MVKSAVAAKERPEEIKETTVEVESQPEILIERVYLATHRGLIMLEGDDAEGDIKAIQEASKGDDADYTFNEEGESVYLAIKDDTYHPFEFPEPGADTKQGQYGLTSVRLFALAVTLASTIERIIELETEPKPSLLDQARKIMTPTIVIVGCIIGIFLIVAMIGG